MTCIIINSDGTEEYIGNWNSIEEGLEELRREGYGITLDLSRVLPQDKSDPKLKEFELIVAAHMKDEAYRAAVCLHEAAHAEYIERTGKDYVAMYGPYVFYKDSGELNYANAHVMGKYENETMDVEDLDYVKSVIAAGIAEEAMTGKPTGGTGLDDAELEGVFDKHEVSAEDRKKLLNKARADILKDLRSPAFRKALWKRAKFYQQILEREMYSPVQEEQLQAA